MFSFQQNFFTETKEVNKESFYALVNDVRVVSLINGLQEHKRIAAAIRNNNGGEDTEESKREDAIANSMKRQLPAFIFQATFDKTKSKKGYEGAWRKQSAARLTGLVVMDIDHVENPLEVVKAWTPNYADWGILLVYVTPSGHGLKVVFKARPEWGNLIDNQHHMAEILGVEVDEACKDASRMSFVCRKDDIIFIDEEIFTYTNEKFIEKYSEIYRGGNSRATSSNSVRHSDNTGDNGGVDLQPSGESVPSGGSADSLEYRGVQYGKIVEAWLDGKTPQQGDRHNTLLKLVTDLRYICDNSTKKIKEVISSLPWVKELVEDGDDLDTLIKSAREYRMFQSIPKRLREVLKKAGVPTDDTSEELASLGGPLPLDAWGEAIKNFFPYFPCLKEICSTLNERSFPAAMFTGAAFLGTLMTRTHYHFYHRPEEKRRLNYCIMVIGDPASGKSFATRLYKLLAAPIKASDKVGYDAINRYKKERQERSTSTKAQKGEALKKPEVIIRDHPARTSNATFIEDMNKAIEIVDGEPMHLHMLTFDSELDNATMTQRGGSWIDKSAMELKAFHNEEDGQAYSNLESISGTFNVYWNFVYTGTPLSLQRKVTERNFGSGLATRLAVIPLPPSGFQMMELKKSSKLDFAADELLKTWAFRLDGVKGELPLWPLVEHTWEWTNDRMKIAAFNDDKADELLMKRVPYYGISVAAPFILMRHWDEWNESKTFAIDDVDRAFCSLALDIQYHCQHHFFGQMARAYFDNMERDAQANRRRPSKYDQCFLQLPKTFTTDDVKRVYGLSATSAAATCRRLKMGGYIESLKKGQFKKLKTSII